MGFKYVLADNLGIARQQNFYWLLNFYYILIQFLKEVCIIFVVLLFQKIKFYKIAQDDLSIWLCYKMLENTMGVSEICLDSFLQQIFLD